MRIDKMGVNSEVILETKDLRKHFGGLQVIDGVDLKVHQGSIHSIIGPNGAGKTTLFNLLTGFLKANAGKIIYRDRDIAGLEPFQIVKNGLARSFQITSVFPKLSVYENIRVSAQANERNPYNFLMSYKRLKRSAEKADTILESIGLIEKKDLPCEQLSYGEKRVLDIGITQATDPKLILLDEPLAGLQEADHERIVRLIKKMAQTLTVVLIDHNIDIVTSISNMITVLNYGAVIAEGTPDEIKSNAKVQEAYLGGL
jgi:ABC-type branched-subunit amino acid transport system ATPase component